MSDFEFNFDELHSFLFNSTPRNRFDTDGDRMGSLRSFQSAVRFGPSAETYANLGVCLMRLGTATPHNNRDEKVTWYHKAYAAITTGKTLAVADKEWQHVDENSKALKQSMNAESVDVPVSLQGLDPLEHPDDGKAKKPKKPRLPGGTFSGTSSSSSSSSSNSNNNRKPNRNNNNRAAAPPMVHRERLLHQKNVPLGHPFPRVSVEDLDGDDPQFELYRQVKK